MAKKSAVVPIAVKSGLTEKDYADLEASWIDKDHAERALIRRVLSNDGQDLIGQPKLDCSGLVFPFIMPGTQNATTSGLRRDNPELYVEIQDGEEVRKVKQRYLYPPGGANRLWFMPGTPMELLKDTSIPVVFTEGAKKGIALERLSRHELGEAADKPRFIACALIGVWNFRGVIGKTQNENGARVDVKGVIPDLDWFDFTNNRRVVIAFDSDTTTNRKVLAAQIELAKEIRRRGGEPFLTTIHPRGREKIGIDDLLGSSGPEEALKVLDSAQALPPVKEEDAKAAAALGKMIEGAEFFRAPDAKLYATISLRGNRETLLIDSGRFKSWLTSSFWNQYKVPLSESKMKETVAICKAKAEFEGDTHAVAIRIAPYGERLYVDIGDDERHAIEIGGDLPAPGWRMIVNAPVRFRRAGSMGVLPWPRPGYSIDELRPFLNADTDDVWVPMVSWLIGTYAPKGPYPVLLLGGEEGCAKTTQMSVLRQLIDPTNLKDGDKRSFPQNERDLVIAANQCHVMSYDNLSDGLQPWQSDALCRISTGGAFATRTMYANEEETVFTICRPIVANGIDDIASRSDLVSRAMIVSLKRLQARRTIEEYSAAFEEAKPRILGAILTAVAAALKARGTVKLASPPRMADFATWVAGAAKAGALPFTMEHFLDVYEQQARAATSVLFEASTIGSTLRDFAVFRASTQPWTGTATELLAILDSRNPDRDKHRAWPKIPATLAKILKRDASTLRANGVEIETYTQGKAKTKMISVKWTGTAEEE